MAQFRFRVDLLRTLLAILVLPPAVGVAQSVVTIDFESVPIGAVLTNQYASSGVLFDCVAGPTTPCNAFGPIVEMPVPPSPCVGVAGRGIAINDETPYSLSFRASFVNPTTLQPACVSSVSSQGWDTEFGSLLFSVVVRDPAGFVIHSAVVMTPLGGCAAFDHIASAPSIATVEVSTDTDGCFLDAMTFSAPTGASVAVFGVGCGSGPPIMTATPPTLGSTATISGAAFTPFSTGSVVVSLGSFPFLFPVGGCTLYVDPFEFFDLAPFISDATGAFTVVAAVPAIPAWSGVSFVMQAYALPTPPGSFELSNAVVATLGC